MKFSILGSYAATKAGHIGDDVLKALASDPDFAEAQIREFGKHVDDLAARVATAQTAADKAAAHMAEKKAELDRDNRAADVLSGKVTAARNAGNEDEAKAIEVKLGPVVTAAERLTNEVNDAQAALTAAAGEVTEWTVTHRDAVLHLTTVRGQLDEARRTLAHAEQEESRAKERKAQAQRDAGLKSGLNSDNLALDAITTKANESLARARADNLTASTLKQTSTSGVDDIVAATLAGETSGEPASAMERLAALRKQQQR